MTDLPDAMIYNIYSKYLKDDLQMIRDSTYLSKNSNKNFKTVLEKYRERLEWITETFPPRIIDTFGGISKFMSYPIIDFRDEYMGCTHYLDRFTFGLLEEYTEDKTIMVGVDFFRRPYVTIKLNYLPVRRDTDVSDSEDDEDDTTYTKVKKGILTIFQRYSPPGGANSWTCASAYGMVMHLFGTGMIRPEIYSEIKTLITKGSVNNGYYKIWLIK